MAHRIVELAPVGSQWEVKRGGDFYSGGTTGGTFYSDGTFTIVSHDMRERRIRYVYDNDAQEMSKSFDTFEHEHKLGNICIVDAPKAASKAAVSLCTGDVIKTGRRCSPFCSNSELTILDIDGLTDKVKYKYNNGAVCTKDLSQFHGYLRHGLITVIGRAPSQVAAAEKGFKADDLFDVSVAQRFEEIKKRLRGMPMNESTKNLAKQMTRQVMPAGVEWELEFAGNDMNLCFGPTARKKMVDPDYAAIEARAMAMSMQPASGSALDRLLATYGTERIKPAKDKPEIKPEVKSAEKPMTRIVNVFLMDTTPGLKASERLIGKVENFATDSRNDTTLLLEMSMEHNLAEMLKAHNLKRKSIINQDILNRVGKTVYLQPIEMSDVKIDIKLVTGL